MAMNLYVDGKLVGERTTSSGADALANRLNTTGKAAVKAVFVDPDTGKPLSKEDMTPTSEMTFG